MDRYWELDFARGLAVIMMVLSNFITDLQFFFNYSNYKSIWWLFARLTAFLFIFIVGIALTISHSRNGSFKKYLTRGAKIFLLGIIITITTYFFIPSDFIIFGALHLIGISIILAYPFLKFKKSISLVSGIIIISLGLLIKNINLNSNYLLWLGIISKAFSSIDYFPLLPWLGVVLLGIVFGKIVYPKGKRRFNIKEKPNLISLLGQYSLFIYFTHQPIILSILFLIK